MSEKHVLVDGGMLYCSQSVDFNSPEKGIPIKVTSQTLVDANGGKLVATPEDKTIENMNFGKCNDPKYRTPPPCKAKVKWSKMHKGVQIGEQELFILTEKSEAICNVCSVAGIIKVAFHGQQATVTGDTMQESSPEVMEFLNPLAEPFSSIEQNENLYEIKTFRQPTATIDQINSNEIR